MSYPLIDLPRFVEVCRQGIARDYNLFVQLVLYCRVTVSVSLAGIFFLELVTQCTCKRRQKRQRLCRTIYLRRRGFAVRRQCLWTREGLLFRTWDKGNSLDVCSCGRKRSFCLGRRTPGTLQTSALVVERGCCPGRSIIVLPVL